MRLTEDQAITVKELKERQEKGEAITVLDVREKHEFTYCNIGGVHIPLGTLPFRVGELDRKRVYAVLCHHGSRSAHATMFLLRSGFTRALNVIGGIDAWSREVDQSVRRY